MKYTLPSGKELDVTVSSFSLCWELTKAILNVARERNLKLDFSNEQGKDDVEINADAILEFIISPEVEPLLKECMKRCVYDSEKLSEDTFEKEERRSDYPIVASRVLTENTRPFLTLLTLRLGVNTPKNTESQK